MNANLVLFVIAVEAQEWPWTKTRGTIKTPICAGHPPYRPLPYARQRIIQSTGQGELQCTHVELEEYDAFTTTAHFPETGSVPFETQLHTGGLQVANRA